MFRLFGIQKTIERFNRAIPRQGWSLANKALITQLGIRLAAEGKTFPKKGSVLVYANHVTGLDPYLLSAVMGRDDVYVLSDIYQTRKGKHVAAHIIPVYYSRWQDAFARSGVAFFGYLMMRLVTGTVSREVSRKKNSGAIMSAVQQLKKGHVVLVFPSGGEKQTKRWKKGIGEIILQCRKKKIPLTFSLYSIKNLSELGLVRHFLTGKTWYQRTPIRITGRKVTSRTLERMTDASEITAYLQKDFLGQQ